MKVMQESFQEYLQRLLGNKLLLKINDNRSTMLSVKWEPDCTKVSLHRIFLNAPQNVMEGLACYLNRTDSSIPKSVKHYIELNLKTLDYSHALDPAKLSTQGNCFDLKALYDKINNEYFGKTLDLSITWFGTSSQSRKRSRLTLGLFHDQLKLIKVNRFLDAMTIPEYLVSFVIYHEMLHFVCPSYIDSKGLHRIHSKEFREKEEQFRYFNQVQRWIQENEMQLFV